MKQCGIDEAGRGPVLGPMVIAMVCADVKDLESLGVRDSKQLSPAVRNKMFRGIMDIADQVEVTIINPPEINKLMKKISLNEIEYLHYANLIRKASGNIYIDCFDVLTARAEERFFIETGKKVVCEHKADQKYASVSSASIIAKVTRDSEIDKLRNRYGEIGSGYPSDPYTVRFLRKAIRDGRDLSEIVRTQWSTYKRIRSESESRILF
ncbi:MAG: ribonuclease HII [Thermoplasmataceae archaeon]